MKTSGNRLLTFLEMIKFEHSIFALPFAYLGLVVAEQNIPRGFLIFWVTLAMVSFRTMAMALNRLIDAKIDAENPRTSNRAIPAGKLTSSFVWTVAVFSLIVFECSCFKLGPLCVYLSPVPISLAFLYPFTKRITWLSHLVLGMVLGIAPYGAWLAARPVFSWVPGFISLGVITWVTGFDIIYALQDETFDRGYGLKSIPSRFGYDFSLQLTRALHVATILFWLLAGYLANLRGAYLIGMLIAAALLVREHWLIRSFKMEKIQEAFFSMNALISLVAFISFFIDSMHLRSR